MFDVDVAISAANVSSLIYTGRAYSGVERKYNWYLYYDICESWLRAYYTTDFLLATHWKLVTSNSLSGHGKPERAYRDRNSHYSDKTLLSSWWKSSTREDAIYSEIRPWSLHSFDLLYNSAYTAQLNCSKGCGIFFGNSYRYFNIYVRIYLFVYLFYQKQHETLSRNIIHSPRVLYYSSTADVFCAKFFNPLSLNGFLYELGKVPVLSSLPNSW